VTLVRGGKRWQVACDYLASGFHLVPNVELPELLGCEIGRGFVSVDQFQQTSVPDVYSAGEATGIGGLELSLIEGEIAGLAAAGKHEAARRLFPVRRKQRKFADLLNRTFALREELKHLAGPETIVCRCEDVTLERLRGHRSWRAAKLQTRCGMGPCQGRICGGAVEFLFGWRAESVRPPVLPVKVASLIQPRKSVAKKRF
jgi:NADPH-dependent 2,4-dienoyl-CoA reductase/sulfur reductase-like enzyme